MVDLTECTFLDSTALGVLIAARKQLRRETELSLVATDRNILKVFETVESLPVQIDNNIYLTSNASWTGSVWNRDDVAVTAWRIDAIAAGNFVINYAAAAANPITWVALVTVTPTGALITSTLIGVPTIPAASSSIPFR